MKVLVEQANGWTAWQTPVMRRYRMGCCDCGLVHDVDFRLVKRDYLGSDAGTPVKAGLFCVQMRARRNNRSTALLRRGKKKK